MKRGENAGGDAEQQGQGESNHSKLEGDGKALRNELRDGEILVPERRAEIPMGQRTQISGVLPEERLIQPVGALQIGHDLGRQRLS